MSETLPRHTYESPFGVIADKICGNIILLYVYKNKYVGINFDTPLAKLNLSNRDTIIQYG